MELVGEDLQDGGNKIDRTAKMGGIADKKLTEIVPLYKDVSANLLLPSTQFDMYSAENAGLVKFDFLGLKTLTVISNTQKLVKKIDKNFIIEKIKI